MSKANVISFFPILEGREKKNGQFPVCIVAYANGQKKRYRIGIDLTKEQWRKVSSKKLRDENLKDIKEELNSFIKKANSVAGEMDDFNFEIFEKAFFEKKEIVKDNITFTQCIQEYIEKNRGSWSVKSEVMYRSLINSIEGCKKSIKIKDFNNDFILKYEAHLTSQGKSITTVGIYLRQIRAICNYAINANYISPDKYPFKNYKIPAAQKNKRALFNEEIKALIYYETNDHNEQKARDFWAFSYMGNGMNFNDIARLKYSNIKNGMMGYVRAKTKNSTRGNQKEIEIFVLPMMSEIITRWGNPNITGDEYIFPIIQEGMSAKGQYNTIAQFIKITNKYLKRISSALELAIPLTTYWARHSYATKLKRGGSSIMEISEGLGHSSIATTENYLSGFTDETIKKNARLLLDL